MINLRYDSECALQDVLDGAAALQHAARKPEQREALATRLPEIDEALAKLDTVRRLLSHTEHEAA
jgi:hypothetical protein